MPDLLSRVGVPSAELEAQIQQAEKDSEVAEIRRVAALRREEKKEKKGKKDEKDKNSFKEAFDRESGEDKTNPRVEGWLQRLAKCVSSDSETRLLVY